MNTIDSYNLKGLKTGTVKLPGALATSPNTKLLTQAVYVALSNKRRGLAKAMTRGESGRTTAKVYRQKHTGRARHGSRSAPIFVGGGVAHGPSGEQNFHKTLPKRMSRLALAQAIALQAGQKRLVAIEGLEKIEPKAKAARSLLDSLKVTGNNILIATLNQGGNSTQAFGNLDGVMTLPMSHLSSHHVLGARMIVADIKAIESFGKFEKPSEQTKVALPAKLPMKKPQPKTKSKKAETAKKVIKSKKI